MQSMISADRKYQCLLTGEGCEQMSNSPEQTAMRLKDGHTAHGNSREMGPLALFSARWQIGQSLTRDAQNVKEQMDSRVSKNPW